MTWKVLLPKFQNTELKGNDAGYYYSRHKYLDKLPPVTVYQAACATVLVTGDKQMLEQAPKFGFNAITLKQFEDNLITPHNP